MSSSNSDPESAGTALLVRFRKVFAADARVFRAPGRVNLIGEHTDYNDGFVMPMAIGYYTWVAASKRDDHVIEAYSEHFDKSVSLSLDELAGPPRKHWSDFVRGVASGLQKAGHRLSGANLLISSDVPFGAGLSSSASFEVSLALALSSISGATVPRLDLVKVSQKAEHEFVGTRCGIMDQFIATFAEKGHALMLDCRSLEFQLLAIPAETRIVVCNSMVRHELASGEYNLRRSDCETSVKTLQRFLPGIRALRDVSPAALDQHQGSLSRTVYRRCRHVVTEDERVAAAAEALKVGGARCFGELMFQSHASLRDDYEVSCKELDLLVDLASSIRGVYGARMTGGGFGGCTVNLVRADCAEEFKREIARKYKASTGIDAQVYICEPAQGAEACTGEGSTQS